MQSRRSLDKTFYEIIKQTILSHKDGSGQTYGSQLPLLSQTTTLLEQAKHLSRNAYAGMTIVKTITINSPNKANFFLDALTLNLITISPF